MIRESLWDGIEGIVIDAVGTLIEPAPPVAEVYQRAALRQGVVLDAKALKSRFARNFRNDEVDEARGPMETDETIEFRRWRRIVSSVLPEVADPDAAFSELWEHFARPDAWFCFPDVGPALFNLRAAGVRIVIGSNFDARLRGVVAGLPEIAEWRDSLVISSEVGYRKPHPKFYEAACFRLGLAPDRVLCVGDDPENDAFGPLRAGCRGVFLDRNGASCPRGIARSPDLLSLTRELPMTPASL
jgi:putative hydrolase of the HAD superfamily